MSLHARVLVVDHDGRTTWPLADRLESLGCAVQTVAPSESVSDVVARWRPDVIFLQAENSLEEAKNTARQLGRDQTSTRAPTVLLTAKPTHGEQAAETGIDLVLPARPRDIELVSRIQALTRFRTMQIELARRSELRRRYGLSRELDVHPIEGGKLTVLTAGKFLDGETDLAEILKTDPRAIKSVNQPREATDQLSRHPYDALVMGVNGSAAPWLTLCADIRNNPRLFNLPIIMIVDDDSFVDPTQPFENGVSDFLVRPVDPHESGNRLLMLVRLDRYRRSLQDSYGEARLSETSDGLTGLYSFRYPF